MQRFSRLVFTMSYDVLKANWTSANTGEIPKEVYPAKRRVGGNTAALPSVIGHFFRVNSGFGQQLMGKQNVNHTNRLCDELEITTVSVQRTQTG